MSKLIHHLKVSYLHVKYRSRGGSDISCLQLRSSHDLYATFSVFFKKVTNKANESLISVEMQLISLFCYFFPVFRVFTLQTRLSISQVIVFDKGTPHSDVKNIVKLS